MSRHRWGVEAVGAAVLAFLPVVCQSQTPNAAASFGDMPDNVKAGHVVIVIDEAGRETRGKVAEVSGSSLVILTRDQNRRWANRAEFAPASVREVKRTGPIWDGALIGFGSGALPGLIVEDCTSCMRAAAVALMWGGIGAGIGLGIDAAFGPKRVYLAPGARRAEILLAPLIGRNRKGASVAFRF